MHLETFPEVQKWKKLENNWPTGSPKSTVRAQRPEPQQLKGRADEIQAVVLTPNNIKKCSMSNSSENPEKRFPTNRAQRVKLK